MSLVAETASYDALAPFYNDRLGQFAERVLPVLDDLVLARLADGARIVDLCCGTGQLAARLAGRGLEVTGIDESSEMLRIARRNASAAEFMQARASAFELDRPVDCVVSTFDSINHLLEPEELAGAFECVSRCLNAGGYFVFDVNMEDGYRSRWSGQWSGSFGDGRYAIHSDYDEAARIGRNVISIDSPDPSACRHWEIRERCYSAPEINESLRRAGLSVLQTLDGHRDLGLFGEWGRSFYVCRKQSGPDQEPAKKRAVSASANEANGTADAYRTVERCIQDGTYPRVALVRELGNDSIRLSAIGEVLRRLRPEHYERLHAPVPRFSWFVPSTEVLGQVHPFPANDAGECVRVVYLSPLLERCDRSVVVTAVAHELCHVILDHELSDPDPETYNRQEREVSDMLAECGFVTDVTSARSTLSDCREQWPLAEF